MIEDSNNEQKNKNEEAEVKITKKESKVGKGFKVNIPKEIREKLSLAEGDMCIFRIYEKPLEKSINNEKVTLEFYQMVKRRRV
jgi:AbrB family looped-hinge helix DNA binding protein